MHLQKSMNFSHIAAVHVGKKPLNCGTCKKSSAKNSDLYNHIASAHGGMKLPHCGICKKNFAENSDLKSHIETVHEKFSFTFATAGSIAKIIKRCYVVYYAT